MSEVEREKSELDEGRERNMEGAKPYNRNPPNPSENPPNPLTKVEDLPKMTNRDKQNDKCLSRFITEQEPCLKNYYTIKDVTKDG